MTLNFSRRPIFPGNPSEDGFVSSMNYAMEGIPDGVALHFNWDYEDTCDCGRDRADRGGGSCEHISNDIIDLLPADPFGMGAALTAITGLFEDLERDRLNIWNEALKIRTDTGNTGTHDRCNSTGKLDRSDDHKGLNPQSSDGGFVSVDNAEDLANFCDKYSPSTSLQPKETAVDMGSCSNGSGGDPPDGFLYALNFLGVQELLSVENVCRSLHSAVVKDPLLWRNIHIQQPLSERINDDALLRLSNRAGGDLNSLSLVDCTKITDDGLKRVLESNPKLTKLCVPGCTKLGIEGFVEILKAFKSSDASGLKHLKIAGLYGVTQQHFEDLKFVLGMDDCMQPKAHKPRFFRSGQLCLSLDDDRAIDLELCPKCGIPRLVYDCPSESCLAEESFSQLCRACITCILRCKRCGRCVNNSEYEETFCLDNMCSDCVEQEKRGATPKHGCFNQNTEQHLHLHG